MKFLILSFKIFFLNILLIYPVNILFAFYGRVIFLKGDAFFYDKKKNTEILALEKKDFDFRSGVINVKKNSKVILFLNDEIELRCNENSKISFDTDYIRVLSGKIWIRKIKSARDLKVKLDKNKYSVKYGSFNMDADKKNFIIYDGIAFNDGREMKRKTESLINDEWVKWNLEYDKVALAIVLKNKEQIEEVKNLIKNFFENRYAFPEVCIYENISEISGADIIMECDINMNADCVKIKSVLKDGVTFETFDLIDNNCEEKGLNNEIIKQKIQDKLFKMLSEFSNNIEREYIKKTIKEGRNVVIEAGITSSDDIKMLEKYIEKIPGTNNIKMQNYYGQKVIFFIKYYGIGSDLMEYLQDKKIGENKINIWKYSKNIVKLDIIKN